MSFLLDTDWIVDALGGLPSALKPLEGFSSDGLAVSVVTFGEVFEGAYALPNPEEHIEGFRRFLSGFVVLGLTPRIMERFAEHRYRLRRQGNLIPDFDLLIAATALEHDLTLVTRNRRHFGRISGSECIRRIDALQRPGRARAPSPYTSVMMGRIIGRPRVCS